MTDNNPIIENVHEITPPVKKKRGRKPKSYYEQLEKEKSSIQQTAPIEPPTPKKRGRKPKGGKIVENLTTINNNNYIKKNVILHLKCNSNDLNPFNDVFNNLSNQDLDFTTGGKMADLNYQVYDSKLEDSSINCIQTNNSNVIITNSNESNYKNEIVNDNDTNIKHINKKLKDLQELLHTNTIINNKSACFWCTCDFDNIPICIPKYKLKNTYHCYGCFCSPECGVSSLMNENIDTSAKFERYHLMNHIYCKIYNYNKNIKPAPNPYYTLDKYYGNLSIQEYRKLLQNDRLFMVVDKPLTKFLPELHEENNDFILNKEAISSNSTYQIRRKTNKPTSKTNILNENFGIIA
jgi:hypothetical protein